VGAVVVVADREAQDAHLASLAVHPAHRRGGLATRLLYDALAQQSPTIRTVSLEVRDTNFRARALYENLGFHVTGSIGGYYGRGSTAIEYRGALDVVLDACRRRLSPIAPG
jgi:ribosomal protein S18 acetylase RimI-like enzyme